MDAALLDTDILNEVLKQKNVQVVAHASAYLQSHRQFAISALSRYEVIRGLKDANATTQLSRFTTFCQNTLILPITTAILDQAADRWVEARRGGHPRSDADLIIAATALEHDLVLVTGNTPHFAWVAGLTLVNWREGQA
jgi:tRNA(fMet)-specific endonuclease VapC